MTLRNRKVVVVFAGVSTLILAFSLWHALRDPKLTADATAAALQQELHTAYGFRCTPEENDGTITGLGDVDCACEAERVSELGYWVATDGSRITGKQSMG